MKTAICIFGTGRCIDHTFDNLKANVIGAFDERDVYVYIAKGPHSDKTRKLFESLGNTFIKVVEEEPLDLSNYSFLPNWPPTTSVHGRVSLDKGRQVYLQMIKSRSVMNDWLDQSGKEYDQVIFSRMDVIYEEPVSKNIDGLDLSKIWIPHFHHWLGGYNDRFAVSNREGMRQYFSVYDGVIKYVDEGHILHAESTLKHHLEAVGSNVGIFKIGFSRIRNGKPHDDFKMLNTQAVRSCNT